MVKQRSEPRSTPQSQPRRPRMDLSMTASETLLVERDGAVATLTLNRPDALNAFSRELRVTFRDAVNEVARDDSVRAVVITGAGRGFSAGQDVRELSAPSEADPIH